MKENIEEDIKVLEELAKNEYGELLNCWDFGERSIKAINNILSDYKRLQEEFKQVDHECERLEQKELRLEKEIEKLKSDNLEYQRTQDIFDERKYRKKYLEERRAEEPNLLYPDADEIYERYYKLKAENEELKRLLKGNLYEDYKYYKNLAGEYQGNCIFKKKIKNKIEKLKQERILKYDNYMGYKIESREQQDINKKIDILQDLLEEKGE